MKIGIDLSPLQGPHRMRGIGYTLINFINNIPVEGKKKHSFVFYEQSASTPDSADPLELINTSDFQYTIKVMKPTRKINKPADEGTRSHGHLIGKIFPERLLQFLTNSKNALLELRSYNAYDTKSYNKHDIDVLLQIDPSCALPHNRGIKKILIIYDIIPYVLEHAYLTSYKTARGRGHSRKGSLRIQAHRWLYIHKLRVNVRHADRLISISEQTEKDFIEYLGVPRSKISVIPLGVSPPLKEKTANIKLHRYVSTPWGYIKRDYKLNSDIPFILFVGGADRRRKIEDVVAAFNILRAQGYQLKLVLAGDSMQGPDNISTEETRKALISSSYIDDIVFMGFVDDKQRDWLYENALVFAFPSKYEGFGLPVLEAMIRGCPVISYPNQATQEVASDSIIYVDDLLGMSKAIVKLIKMDNQERTKIIKVGLKHASKYSWGETASRIFVDITS